MSPSPSYIAFGPLVVGLLVALAVFGVNCYQMVRHFVQRDDRKPVRAIIVSVMALSSVHIALAGWFSWRYSVWSLEHVVSIETLTMWLTAAMISGRITNMVIHWAFIRSIFNMRASRSLNTGSNSVANAVDIVVLAACLVACFPFASALYSSDLAETKNGIFLAVAGDLMLTLLSWFGLRGLRSAQVKEHDLLDMSQPSSWTIYSHMPWWILACVYLWWTTDDIVAAVPMYLCYVQLNAASVIALLNLSGTPCSRGMRRLAGAAGAEEEENEKAGLDLN